MPIGKHVKNLCNFEILAHGQNIRTEKNLLIVFEMRVVMMALVTVLDQLRREMCQRRANSQGVRPGWSRGRVRPSVIKYINPLIWWLPFDCAPLFLKEPKMVSTRFWLSMRSFPSAFRPKTAVEVNITSMHTQCVHSNGSKARLHRRILYTSRWAL